MNSFQPPASINGATSNTTKTKKYPTGKASNNKTNAKKIQNTIGKITLGFLVLSALFLTFISINNTATFVL